MRRLPRAPTLSGPTALRFVPRCVRGLAAAGFAVIDVQFTRLGHKYVLDFAYEADIVAAIKSIS